MVLSFTYIFKVKYIIKQEIVACNLINNKMVVRDAKSHPHYLVKPFKEPFHGAPIKILVNMEISSFFCPLPLNIN